MAQTLIRFAPVRSFALGTAVALVVSFATFVPVAALAQPAPPELTAPVNDFADVIPAAQERELDSLIRRLQAASGDVVVVATIKTFQPWGDIRTYAVEMFENHGKGIGQKGRDNGLLLLLAVDDREVWVEVGYDLEGFITDGFAGETSRQTMVPYFRSGDYGGGLLAGATRLVQRIAEGRNVTIEGLPISQPTSEEGDGGLPIIAWFILAMILLNLFRGSGGGRRRGRRWSSHVGPFGSGYGGWTSHRGGGWSSGGGGFGGGFGGFGGGRSGGGGGGASW